MCKYCDWDEVLENIDEFFADGDAWLFPELTSLKNIIEKFEHVTGPQRKYADLMMYGNEGITQNAA